MRPLRETRAPDSGTKPPMPTIPMLTAPVPPEGGSAAEADPIGADEAISVRAAPIGEVNRLRRERQDRSCGR